MCSHNQSLTSTNTHKGVLTLYFPPPQVVGATCDGVSEEAMCAVAGEYGYDCNIVEDFSKIDTFLTLGPVITHVRQRTSSSLYLQERNYDTQEEVPSCKFTKGGHYIVLASSLGGGNYTVLDPNSSDPSRSFGTIDEITKECSFVAITSISKKITTPRVSIS